MKILKEKIRERGKNKQPVGPPPLTAIPAFFTMYFLDFRGVIEYLNNTREDIGLDWNLITPPLYLQFLVFRSSTYWFVILLEIRSDLDYTIVTIAAFVTLWPCGTIDVFPQTPYGRTPPMIGGNVGISSGPTLPQALRGWLKEPGQRLGSTIAS